MPLGLRLNSNSGLIVLYNIDLACYQTVFQVLDFGFGPHLPRRAEWVSFSISIHILKCASAAVAAEAVSRGTIELNHLLWVQQSLKNILLKTFSPF